MELKILEAIFISLQVSIMATVLSIFISLPIGVILGTKNFPFKNIVILTISSFTAIPPVCAGLVCYLIVSRTGPFGWMGILYTPLAMMIAQFIIIAPIMITLIYRNIQSEFPSFKEELESYGAKLSDIIKLLLINKYKIYITISVICFNRAISEYGAASIVGGSIDHITRNVTATIAQETSKGNLYLALQLGLILIVVSFVLSLLFQIEKK
tara:strand:- start:639 stop:1271 length:633 start_codon:yes stop_codon:yes gene_type:complete